MLNGIHIATLIVAIIAGICWALAGHFGAAAWTCCISGALFAIITVCRLGGSDGLGDFLGIFLIWTWFD